jgi:hypothetical protein
LRHGAKARDTGGVIAGTTFVTAGNYFGPVTKKKLTERQNQQGQPADGIFTPELDTLWGWNVFGAPPGT